MPLVGESEWIMAEFTIGGVAMDSAVKGVTTGLRDLGGGCCKLGTTCGVDANVTLVRVLISEDTVVTTFAGLVAASVEELSLITAFSCDCKYSCIWPKGSSSSSGRSRS